MGFVWVHVESFLHSVAPPFDSFVTTHRTSISNAFLDINILCSWTLECNSDDHVIRCHAFKIQQRRHDLTAALTLHHAMLTNPGPVAPPPTSS